MLPDRIFISDNNQIDFHNAVGRYLQKGYRIVPGTMFACTLHDCRTHMKRHIGDNRTYKDYFAVELVKDGNDKTEEASDE